MSSPPIATQRFWLAAVLPAALGVSSVWFCISVLGKYGFAIFLLTPVVIGVAATVVYRPLSRNEFGLVLLTNLISYLLIGLVVAALQFEGLVCMAMAVPLALPTTFVATLITYLVLKHRARTPSLPLLIVGLLSLVFVGAAFESSTKNAPELHTVITTIHVDAPIEKVWQNVVEFPQIETEPDGIMRLGFAYPVSAHINGKGIGAIRECNFNTGPFVEPITAWDEPHRLAFDVQSQPPIMVETGLTGTFQTAHLSYLKSQRGEFVLREDNGGTLIEGTTFYTHDIAPDRYWQIYSDAIIHQIHLRVLNHIKQASEADAAAN